MAHGRTIRPSELVVPTTCPDLGAQPAARKSRAKISTESRRSPQGEIVEELFLRVLPKSEAD